MVLDVIRVRYRQERRALIREVILQEIAGSNLDAYIITKTDQLIPTIAREEFINDVKEDLAEMDESRLAVLGLSLDQLNKWAQKR